MSDSSSSSDKQQVTMVPKYKSLGRVNAEEYVTVKLISGNMESSNYSSWKPQMEALINHHQLLGFIDGSIEPPYSPPGSDDEEGYDRWMTDKVVKWWFHCTITEPKLITLVRDECDTAREAWLALENTFQEEESPSMLALENTFQEEEIPANASEQENETGEEDDTQEENGNPQIALLQAALHGNWDEAQKILDNDPSAARAYLDNVTKYTPLAIAVSTRNANHFVKKLLECMANDEESIALKDTDGNTALHIAATVGNTGAAEMLVRTLPNLCYISNKWGNFPIQNAAKFAHKNTLIYLMSVTRNDREHNPYANTPGLLLLTSAINAEFFDIATYLVKRYPYLAGMQFSNGNSALGRIAGRSELSNRGHFNFWERFVSFCIPTALVMPRCTIISNEPRDIEKNMTSDGIQNLRVFEKLNVMAWKIFIEFVPHIRNIKKKSQANDEALQLVKLLCEKLKSLGKDPKDIYQDAILKATELGVQDVVEVIIGTFPLAIFAIQLPSKHSIFHKAIENRSENVFNLICQMSDHKRLFSTKRDCQRNNLLHLAGKLAPSHKLDKISGAALQMQRELQWFKEVEMLVKPNAREKKNCEGKTPKEVFTEEHKELRTEGEKWMKDTADSCTISAALIATIVFAAVITVPGGNKSDEGYPIFSKKPAFIIFAVSDAISLFTSITSLLLFLAILTTRYAEEDFLSVLPKRMIFGLATLFLSITSMMIAFSATLYLVLGHSAQLWALSLLLIISCFPVASFVLLQFPLLIDLISTTYGPGIFGKKSNRFLY